MSTDESTGPTNTIPHHVKVGAACAFLAVLLAAFAIAYYTLVAQGALPAPPPGVGPLWSTAIAVPAMVPIVIWATQRAARPALAEIAALRAEQRASNQATRAEFCGQLNDTRTEIRDALTQFGERALQSAREAGKLQGVVAELRSNPPAAETSAEVIGILDRVRNGSGRM